MNNNQPEFPAIAQSIDPQASQVRHWPLTGGVSAQVEAVEFRRGNGSYRQIVVRRHGAADWKQLDDDVTATEFYLQSALYDVGLPVPEPLFLDESCSVLPSPYLVMAMVAGTTAVDANQLPSALRQMADFLLRLHSLEPASMGLKKTLPRSENPVAGALQYVPDTAANGSLRAALANWETRPGRSVLLHGDFWPGNILWQDEKIAAVLDWEDATIGPVTADLAGCRSELMAIYGARAMDEFTRTYLAGTDRDMSDLPVWEVYASFAALSSMADWGLPRDVEASRRARTEQFAQRAAREVENSR